ncbi:hypothetical protein [Flavobacterium sp. 245]|uniref:hypothetical protein n=1 Tax=Flavobacterium sp. 245 TaxID=2512115 RepID=UPI0010612F77|nr:hypothetical protein [Flavobacterium sp. 245]TDO96095.1 hypothetical protein EV145_11268 [Flavobacterium sp. 245]
MKSIELNEMTSITGGSASQVIGGICIATGLSRLAGLFTPAAPVAAGITIGCAINAIGGNQGWW